MLDHSNSRLRILVLSLFLISLFVADFSTAPPAGAVLARIESLRTDGTHVVWIHNHDLDSLFVDTVDGGAPQMLAQGIDIRNADVSGSRVVWIQNGRLSGINLVTGQPLDLPAATEPGAQDAGATLYESVLVWLHQPDEASSWQIRKTDLDTTATPEVLVTLPSDTWLPHRPVVSEDRVVWGVSRGVGTGFQWELWTTRTGENSSRIASGSGDLNLSGYDISGTTVVYSANQVVSVLDLDSPGFSTVLSEKGRGPTTDGRYVFWSDWQWEDPSQPQNPLGYDLLTDSYVGAKLNQDWITRGIWTRNGVVVWAVEQEFTGLTVHTEDVENILPSAPLPDPGTTDPVWLYFDKTGHYVSYGFKDFWQRSGGLPVFGYPLTTEFPELNPELGEMRTVQYLERQRFEYHPAYAGTPYETLLGRLGYADAVQRDLLDHQAFQRLPDDTQGDASSKFFPQTGHLIGGEFRAYWESHGLDFGDPGISFRESLALFGYPISEEFVDPDTGLVTQYFERAVFEYHPDNPDPYRVLLRRLGAEQIELRGW